MLIIPSLSMHYNIYCLPYDVIASTFLTVDKAPFAPVKTGDMVAEVVTSCAAQ